MKKVSTSQKIRTLIERGYSNKYIVEKLQCNPRAVYNIRYRINKDRGIAALSRAEPKAAPTATEKPTVVWNGVVDEDGMVVRMEPEVPEGTGIKKPGSVIEFVGPEPIDWKPIIYGAFIVVIAVLLAAILLKGGVK